MASIDAFIEKVEQHLEGIESDSLDLLTGRGQKIESIAKLAKVLESSHQVAMRTLTEMISDEHPDIANILRENLGEIDGDADQYAESEFGYVLYWMEAEPDQASAGLVGDQLALLGVEILRNILPASVIKANHIEEIFGGTTALAQRRVWVTDDGEVVGTAQYELLDIGWLKAVQNLISTVWHDSFVKPFPKRAKFETISLQAGRGNQVKIAIIGDWGGGNALAREVMQTVNKLNPDYVIHLGDTYYAGTDQKGFPANEEQDFLVDFWKKYGPANKGRCFTLNSNHEMYSGARGYFNVALPDAMFSAQGEFSYFALEFGNWIIAGLDSAYNASLPTFLTGNMGGTQDPQYEFLEKISKLGKKTILMSHHNPISYNGDTNGWFGKPSELWTEITNVISPNYWYWGHLHLAAVYNELSAAGEVNGRCVGHSCIPFGTPRGLVKDARVDWFSNSKLNDPDEVVYPDGATRTQNGFAMITLKSDEITEEFYNAGSTTPIYTVPSVN